MRTHLATIYRKLGVSSKLQLHKVLEGGKTPRAADGEQAELISELALSLEEAISRERALSEILRIISGSEGRIEEVMELVLGYALELCDAEFGLLLEYRVEGGFRASFTKGIPPAFHQWWVNRGEFRPGPKTAIGRMAATKDVVNLVDVRLEEVYRSNDPLRIATVELGGARSFTAIPMLAAGRLIGAFTIYRQQLRPFDDKTVQLARIFADQSVIAIENARMVGELRSRADLSS